jgi:branched-chain amino acid transport system substrate-binding protein
MTRRRSTAGGREAARSRRGFLRAAGAGAAGTAGLLGTAGCVQQAGGGGGGSGGDVGPVTFGALVPLSGGSSPLGKAQRRGIELGVRYVDESDAFDFEVDAVYEDTRTEPSTGRQKARKLVQDDGARYVVGALESSVALAVADYVGGEEVVFTTGAATVPLTGAECNANTFRNETNAAQQMAGLADFAAEELGSRWWFHTTDDAYGNSALDQLERRVEARGLDVDVVGRTMPEFGTSNYSPQISRISNSDAEVLVLPDTGGDLINFMKQASNAGLKEEVEIIGTALFAKVSRGALGQVAAGTYSSTLYNHKLDTGDNAQFVEAYRDEYDTVPGSFARVGYEVVRTTARGIRAAGTADPTRVRETLEGLEMTTVLGETAFRECDHQSTNPVWTGEIVAASEGEGTEVNLLSKVPGEEAIRPCDATGCTL